MVSLAHAGPAEDSRLPAAPMHEVVVNLPGDPLRPVMLEVTLFTPPGAGPFPLAVMNHGATNASATNRGDRYRFTTAAYYFLSRGYAVALPMMRGFANSGGSLLHLRCDLAGVAEENGRDIRAVIAGLAVRPEIDGTRIVVAGQSFGAWNTLGVGVRPLAGLHGLVLFNAALRASDCGSQDRAMAESAGELGGQTKVPSLWFYGDNDTVMPNQTWQAVFEQYKDSGAQAELVPFGKYGLDSHQLLSDPASLAIWAPKVDGFLRRVGLPSGTIYPDFLPTPAPRPTHWAALADASAVPNLNDKGRALYQRFLASPLPRAFALSLGGSVGLASGGYDPVGRVLKQCAQASGPCLLYAVNNDVVWTGARPGAPAPAVPLRVTKTVPMNVSTTLAAFFDVNPDCTPRQFPTISIAQTPAHGVAAVAPRNAHPTFPSGNPRAACNALSIPAVGVTYTPTAGYTGADTLTLLEVTAEGRHRTIQIGLSVF